MNPQMTQRTVKILSQVLQGLYEEASKLREARKWLNEKADEYAMKAFKLDANLKIDEAKAMQKEAEEYRKSAEYYSKVLKKFVTKYKNLEETQQVLKQELKDSQRLWEWSVESDAFWLEWAKVAREEGYVAPCVIPPDGWYCTRGDGHEGPCAAWPVEE